MSKKSFLVVFVLALIAGFCLVGGKSAAKKSSPSLKSIKLSIDDVKDRTVAVNRIAKKITFEAKKGKKWKKIPALKVAKEVREEVESIYKIAQPQVQKIRCKIGKIVSNVIEFKDYDVLTTYDGTIDVSDDITGESATVRVGQCIFNNFTGKAYSELDGGADINAGRQVYKVRKGDATLTLGLINPYPYYDLTEDDDYGPIDEEGVDDEPCIDEIRTNNMTLIFNTVPIKWEPVGCVSEWELANYVEIENADGTTKRHVVIWRSMRIGKVFDSSENVSEGVIFPIN